MLNTANIVEKVNEKVVNMPQQGSEEQVAQRVKENKKAKKQAEASNMLEDKLNKQAELLETLNIDNQIPPQFLVGKNGIVKLIINKEGKISGFKNISGTPVFVDRVEEDYDNHSEKTVLILYIRGKLRKESFPSEELIGSTSIIKSLGRVGVSIDSNTAKDMSEYIRLLKDCNCNKDIDNHIVFNSIGWKNNEKFFAYPTPEDKQVVIGKLKDNDDYTYSEEIKEKFMQSKNTNIYRNTFLKVFDKNVYTQLACLTSLSGPFLQLMSTPNILLYFYGNSSNSKTAIMKFAQSAWYNAEVNAVTFNSTSIALDNTLGQYSGTTLLIDERQSLVGDRKLQERVLTQFIYSAVNGIGRARGQKNQEINNGLRKVQKFHLSIMATGEEKILGDEAKSGAQNRILEIPVENQIFTQDEAREIYRVISLSYGGLGVEFLSKALQLIENENIDLIEKNFYLQGEIMKQVAGNEKSERQVQTLTTLAIVDYLLRRTIFCDDEHLANEHMLNFVKNTSAFLMDKDKTDEVTKSKNLINDFCSEYDNFIKDAHAVNISSNSKIYGYKTYNEFSGDTTYYLIYNALKAYTDSKDESILKLLKNLNKEKLVKQQNGSYKIPRKFRNTNISGTFVIYTKKSENIKEVDLGVEDNSEEIAEINRKIDEKHNVVREQPQPPKQQEIFVDMSKNETNTTINDLYGEEITNNCDEDDRPW